MYTVAARAVTDRQTDTHTQDDYSNPRACAPRVKNGHCVLCSAALLADCAL